MKLKKLFSLSLAVAMLLSTAALPVAAGDATSSVTVATAVGGTATVGTQTTTGSGKYLRYVWEGAVVNLESGTKVGAIAEPATGYKFTKWEAEGVNLTTEQQTANALIFEMGNTNVRLTPVFEQYTETVSKTVPFYWDFENVGGASYGNTSLGTAWEGGKKQTTELSTYSRYTDDTYGRSLVLGSNTSNYVNTDTNSQMSEQDWVFGFEAYLTQSSQFSLTGIGTNNTTDTIKDVIKVGSKTVTTHTGTQRDKEYDDTDKLLTDEQLNNWHKFVVAISYTQHEVTVYMDGELLSKVKMNDAFNNTKRWNFNKAANVMFDNIYGYYRNAATTTGDTNITAETTSAYDITTTQLLHIADDAAATLTPKTGDAIMNVPVNVAVNKTTSTITLSGLEGKLEQDTEYDVTFTGITDLFGGAITHSFKTRSTKQTIAVEAVDKRNLPQDTKTDIKITTHNISNGTLSVTQNGTPLKSITIDANDLTDDDTFEETLEVTLVGGENKFEVAYGDIKGTLIMNARKFETVETMVDTDFGADFTEDGNNLTLGKCTIKDTGDTAHGTALRFEGADAPYILLQKADEKKVETGVIIAEGAFNTTANTTFEIFKVRSPGYTDASGKQQTYWSQPFYVENLKLYLHPVGGGEDQCLKTLTAGEWYRFKTIFDVDANTMTLILNDRVLVLDHPANYGDSNFKGFQYINQRLKVNNNDANAGYWLDNVKCRIAVGNYGYTLTGENDKERVSTNGTINVNFTEEMDKTTLAGITVTDESGNTVAKLTETLSDDKKTYSISVGGLKNNAPYTVTVPATVKTANGAGGASGSKVIWSEKSDFSIDSATLTKGADGQKIEVQLNGAGNNGNNGYIAIYAFAGSKLLDVSYVPVENGDINGMLNALDITNAPAGETVTYGVALFEGFDNLQCIDFIELGDIK